MSPSGSARLRAVVALSAAGGGIHLAVVQEHLREGWLTGLFFVVVGTGQLVWAALVAADPSRLLLASGVAANAAVVGLWLASRTVGLPLGAHPGAAEPVGLADLLASAFEVGVVWGGLALALPGHGRPARADARAAAKGSQRGSSLRPLPRWVTVREATLLTGTSEETVRSWVRQGRVAARTLTLRASGLTLVRSDDLVALVPVDLAAWGFGRPALPAASPRAPRSAPPVLSRAGAWALAAACLFGATAGGLVVTERLVSGAEGGAGVAGERHGGSHHAGAEAPGAADHSASGAHR
ncbi:MAG TPA: helix-turn-helix domain-containing protein, partial [Actinomycetota bacterium]|nr:helix-turn-helix domain-containing protein [Actinomycetota bacterium]